MSENKTSISEILKLAQGAKLTSEEKETLTSEEQKELLDKKEKKVSKMFKNIADDLSSKSFKIGDFDFKIKKLNALDSWKIFDETREVTGQTEASSGNFNVLDFMKLPHDFVNNRLIATFFPKIDYCIRTSESGHEIWRSVDIGLDGLKLGETLEAIDIYELLLRSVFVNFTKSAKSIMEKIKSVTSEL